MDLQQTQPQSPAGIPPIQETSSGFPQVPESPTEVPGIADPNMTAAMSQEEMKANLQGMMSKIEALNNQNKAGSASLEIQNQKDRSAALQQIFELFQQNGIDPGDVEQVKAFLAKIQQSNPELASMVEKALVSILGEEGGEVPPTEGEVALPQDNMNINPNEQTGQNI